MILNFSTKIGAEIIYNLPVFYLTFFVSFSLYFFRLFFSFILYRKNVVIEYLGILE